MRARLSTFLTTLALPSIMALLVACGGDYAAELGPGGGFGATPGGVKDMQLAREIIKNGRVPPREAFLVEGMFSEHDLPLDGSPCGETLCLRGAIGIAPTLQGESSGWVQIGMSSTLNPATYTRPDLTAIFTVDVSGSMGWERKTETGTYPSAGAVANRLLRELALRLGPQDRVAIVTYGSTSKVALNPVAGDDPAVLSSIESLHTDGSTNMEAGLTTAYALAAREVDQGRQVRLFLFTDEQPNVGATSATQFDTIVRSGAAAGASLTIFGLGLGLDSTLMNAMAHLRGGNAFSLTRLDQVQTLLDESWPYMAHPIAYDLNVQLTPASGFTVHETYGFPGSFGSPKFDVSSVFISKKRGALLIRVTKPGATPGPSVLSGLQVSGVLDYKKLDGSPVRQALDVRYNDEALDGRGMFFAQPSVGSSVALAILVSNMRQAAELYASNRAAAVDLMKEVVLRISGDRDSLGDASLTVEAQLAADLLANMERGASQESFY